jgi:hypothetical protein
MKRNTHIIVPEARFHLTQGQHNLSCYQVLPVHAGDGALVGGLERPALCCAAAAESCTALRAPLWICNFSFDNHQNRTLMTACRSSTPG